MKFLKMLFYFVVFLLLSYFVAGFFLKKEFSIERSIVINQPDSVVYRFFTDLNQFKVWNVWTGNIPEVEKKVLGNGNMPGDTYIWNGQKIGEGEFRNISMIPYRFLNQELTFKRPSKKTQFSDTYFNPLENNTKTKVIWRYYGKNESTLDCIFLFLYSKILMKDLDKGLQNANQMIMKKANP